MIQRYEYIWKGLRLVVEGEKVKNSTRNSNPVFSVRWNVIFEREMLLPCENSLPNTDPVKLWTTPLHFDIENTIHGRVDNCRGGFPSTNSISWRAGSYLWSWMLMDWEAMGRVDAAQAHHLNPLHHWLSWDQHKPGHRITCAALVEHPFVQGNFPDIH